jgi:hypothetical protein
MATRRELVAWRYNWANLSLGNIHTETWFSRLDARMQIIVAKSKEVKTRWLKKRCMRFCIPVILKSLAAIIRGLKYMLAFTSEPVPSKMAALSVVRSVSASGNN